MAMADTLVVYVCAKCGNNVAKAHLGSKGRLLCYPCEADRRKFIERHQSQHAPG